MLEEKTRRSAFYDQTRRSGGEKEEENSSKWNSYNVLIRYSPTFSSQFHH